MAGNINIKQTTLVLTSLAMLFVQLKRNFQNLGSHTYQIITVIFFFVVLNLCRIFMFRILYLILSWIVYNGVTVAEWHIGMSSGLKTYFSSSDQEK